jgi:NAD(P)-dependent dehydrogenase (short-subunit alcohol dehydrogenase family)
MPNILITGASRGIGLATAQLCAAHRWPVAINYVANHAAAEAAAASLRDAGGQACTIQADITSEPDIIRLFETAAATLGPLTGVVINAGIVAPASRLADMTAERLRRVFNTNIYGAYLCAREAARRLQPGGAIVLVSSAASRLGSPNEFVDYAGSKGAIDSLTIGLAKELGPQNIRVNAVRPGLIDTEIHASAGIPDRAARLGATTPIGRAGTAAEVAAAIIWLLSDAASYTTGALLDVAGGR